MKKSFTLKRLANFIFLIAEVVYLTGCKKNVDEYALHTSQTSQATEQTHFTRGIFMLNEGVPGVTRGSINWKEENPTIPVLDQNIYVQQNPGKYLGGKTLYGAVWNGKLYVVSQQTTPLVVTDAVTLVETARLNSLSGARAFTGLTPDLGLISTSHGVFKLNLNPLSLGSAIDGVTGRTADMLQAGNYIFILSENRGIIVLNKNTFSIVKTIGGPNNGLTQTPDGSVFTAGDSILYKIDNSSLKVTKIHLPFAVKNIWFYEENVGSLTACTRQNAVYIEHNGIRKDGYNHIYRYIVGNPSTLLAPFATSHIGYAFLGVPCFTATGALVVNTQAPPTLFPQNVLVSFNGSGEEIGYFPYYKPNGNLSVLIPVFN